jgi:predicted transposase YbfD/YdcC
MMSLSSASEASVRVGLDEVMVHFEELEDPRSSVNLKHPLVSVVVIAVMGVLAGAGGPAAIAEWAWIKREWLLTVLPLPHGIPRKDVFRRVLSALQPGAFQACFTNWLSSLRDQAAVATGITQPVLAIDGKTLRRSHDRANGLGALHSVSIWASDYGLSLGQVATDEKSNEITAIPELLKLVDIRGAIITIDAMGTQTAIAQDIIDGGGDYVLALKGNQETLHQAVIQHIDQEMQHNFSRGNARRHVTRETGHGRDEVRHYIQMPVPQDLPGRDRWPNLLTIGVAMLSCLRDGKETAEIRYFISSLPLGVKRFAHAIRSHWAIENTCHWSLDVTYREDDSRIRDAHVRENFAWLNRFTLSLLKQHQNGKSLTMNRRRCAWDDDTLLQILTGQAT